MGFKPRRWERSDFLLLTFQEAGIISRDLIGDRFWKLFLIHIFTLSLDEEIIGI